MAPILRVTAIHAFSTASEPGNFPLFAVRVPAGFPSPADDYVDQKLDLNTHLVEHPAATFFTRVSGHSMRDAGIHDGDLLIVDRALEPQDGRIVIAAVNGELTVKRLRIRKSQAWLMPEHPDYRPISITEGLDCVIWGVVTRVIHAV
jgi:DNA polymerase V